MSQALGAHVHGLAWSLGIQIDLPLLCARHSVLCSLVVTSHKVSLLTFQVTELASASATVVFLKCEVKCLQMGP
jgi:hypothetical protein